MGIALALLVQLAVLCVIPFGAFALAKLGVPRPRYLIAAFLLYGLGIGILSAVLWPQDISVYINLPGTAAGDWLYRFAIAWVGDPRSDQAHYTIPWILRIPQVYALASLAIYGAAGIIAQLFITLMTDGRQKKQHS